MQRINLRSSQLLSWVQPKAFSRYWELLQDGNVAGKLSWEGAFSHKAVAEFADGRWFFNQPRLFKADIQVTKEGLPGDIAIGRINWRGHGTLEFTDGKTYKWTRSGFFCITWHLVTATDQQMLDMTRKNKFIRTEADIQVSPFVADDPHLPVLIGFLWYLVQIERRRSAAVVAG